MSAALELPPRCIVQAAIKNGNQIEDKDICILQRPGRPKEVWRWYTGPDSGGSHTKLEQKRDVLEEHLRYLGRTGIYIPKRHGHYIEQGPNDDDGLVLYTCLEYIDGVTLPVLQETVPKLYLKHGDIAVRGLGQYRGWAQDGHLLYDIAQPQQFMVGHPENDSYTNVPTLCMPDIDPRFTNFANTTTDFDDDLLGFKRSLDDTRKDLLNIINIHD